MSTQPVFDSLSINAARKFGAQLFERLRKGSMDATRGGVCRDTYGKGEAFAHELLAAEARSLGLLVQTDPMCNTYMIWPGGDRDAPQVIVGSHLDSVPGGGNFDGAAGVVAGLAAVCLLKQEGVRLSNDLVVMGIRAEESMWFAHSYVGSRGALGLLDPTALEKVRFDTGRSLVDHLQQAGGDPQFVRQRKAWLDTERIAAFFELHIEQAPSLAVDGCALAVGTAIPGNVRYPDVRIEGQYGHVGLQRRFRHDAALAGAKLFVGLDDFWQEQEARGKPMAFTIGEFHTDPARHGLTIVPGQFRFSLDLRAYDQTTLSELEQRFLDLVKEVQERYGVRVILGPCASAPVALADADLSQSLRDSATELGVDCRDLLSPASHDAAAFCSAGVPYGFVFVRNPNGSHHPDEAMDIEDWLLATQVLTRTLCKRYVY